MDIIMARDTSGMKLDYWGSMDPSTGACIVFALFYGIGSIVHIYQLIKYRAWYFSAFVVGAIMMTFGYIFRYISIKNSTTLSPYVAQSLLILLPPSLYAATIYMIYGRIVLLVDAAHLSLIRPTRVTKVFVCSDVLAFLIQAGGGGMLTSAGNETLGKNILLVGLFVQLASFIFFLCVSAVFYFRVKRASEINIPSYGKYHWTTMLKVLYFAAAFIIIRCVFRVIEFSAGHDSSLRQNEIWAYCLDAVPMLAVQSVFHFVHGGMVLPRGGSPKREPLAGGDSQYELSRGSV